jgi:hypothetical protein
MPAHVLKRLQVCLVQPILPMCKLSPAQELSLNGTAECRRTADSASQTSQRLCSSDQHHRV